MKLEVSKMEFQRSFEKHYKLYKDCTESNSSKKMLLFYAVECGLKSKIMYKERVHNFTKLSEESQKCGHDLKKMLKILGISKFELGEIKTKHNDIVRCSEYNQFWRYGIDALNADENDKVNKIESELIKVAEWIKNN